MSPTPSPAAPSWRRVLATTIGLWVSRRLPRVGARSWSGHRRRVGIRFRGPAWPPRRPYARGLRLPILVLVLALAAAAVAVLRFAGTPSPAARSSVPVSAHPAPVGYRAVRTGASAGTAATARSQAATWIADQVSGNETIACDPSMCAELHAAGVAASRLRPLPSATAGVPGADLIVASASIRGPLGSRIGEDTPVLLASFGSGGSRIEVRATSPGGAAAYTLAIQADLAARRTAGAQLLDSRRLEFSAQAAGALEAGDVDTRVLVTLVTLATLQPLRVTSFADASPGGQVPLSEMPFRQVTVVGTDSRGGAAGLKAALALLRAQRAPYQPDQVTVLDATGGRVEIRIEFAAPSPLGLLTGGAPG
jgi:hypothetical protein